MRFNFDGKGINDKEDQYAPRVATLTDHGHAIGAGKLLAAAPDLANHLSLAAAALIVVSRNTTLPEAVRDFALQCAKEARAAYQAAVAP